MACIILNLKFISNITVSDPHNSALFILLFNKMPIYNFSISVSLPLFSCVQMCTVSFTIIS